MPFRATNTIPENAYAETKKTMVRLKGFCDTTVTNISGGTDADVIVGTLNFLSSVHARLTALRATPGIGAYARDQENDQDYDVAAEFNAALSLLDSTLTWLRAAFPTDGNGYILVFKIVNDRLEPRTFTSTQVSTLVTRLQDISASVV